MKLYLLLISLLLNCVNLEELKNAEPMNYLYGVVVANLRGSLAGSSNQATFQILYNGKEYLSGDTIEIRANKSNIEYSAEIFIKNNSNKNLSLTGGDSKVLLSGNNSSNFKVTNPNQFILTPGISTSFKLIFNTNTLGDKSAEIKIPNDDSVNNDFSIKIKGIFSPSQTFVLGPEMVKARNNYSAILLNSGRVLFIGGNTSNSDFENTSEIFNPINNSIDLISGPQEGSRSPSLTLLDDGKVFLSGGFFINTQGRPDSRQSTYFFNENDNSFTQSILMNQKRVSHCSIKSLNGNVYLFGGYYYDSQSAVKTTSIVEIINPFNNSITTTNLSSSKGGLSCVPLPNNKVLLIGGFYMNNLTQGTALSTIELFDMNNNSSTAIGNMTKARNGVLAYLINSNNVLIIDGDGTSEIFNLTTNISTAHSSLNISRYDLSGDQFIDNKNILLPGGTSGSALNVVEMYDNSIQRFIQLNSMTYKKSGHKVIRLNDNRVIVGGDMQNSKTTEIYYR